MIWIEKSLAFGAPQRNDRPELTPSCVAARQVSGPLQSPGPDVEGAVDGGDSDHCSDSGGTSTADGEVRDWGLDLDGNEVGGEGGML